MPGSPRTEVLRVDLAERSYDLEISSGNLAEAGRFLASRAKTEHVVLVTDDHVHRPHAMLAAESIGRQEIDVDVIVVEPGEDAKSPEAAESLWQGLLELGADRETVVAAVGGGVIGDLAGFVAATFARGLPWVQFPTSLLAQVDSSVGGKVGIDLPEAKNIVGAFHQPLGVLIDTHTLATLPDDEYRAGLAEAVKYGVALDAEFFAYLEAHAAAICRHDATALRFLIARCCRLKAGLVEQDECDRTGLRAVLNLGHTFGHAYEMLSHGSEDQGRRGGSVSPPLPLAGEGPGVLSQNTSPLPLAGEGPGVRAVPGPLRHGEAVAIGMVLAARLAERLGRAESPLATRIAALLAAFGLPVEPPPFDPRRVLDIMAYDKKARRGQFRFVLPTRLGHAQLSDTLDPADVRSVVTVHGVTECDRRAAETMGRAGP
jgi:3-dehydroquinate synthase